MIHPYNLVTGLNYLELIWTHPKFLPERYQLKYMCMMRVTSTYKNVTENHMFTNTKNLTSVTTSARMFDLRPRTTCAIILLAVYNPASIDPGIAIMGTTLHEYSSKKNSCLIDFIITLGYCLRLPFYIQPNSQHG